MSAYSLRNGRREKEGEKGGGGDVEEVGMNRELKKKKVQKSSIDAKKVQRMNQMLMPVRWTGAAGVKQWGPKNKIK